MHWLTSDVPVHASKSLGRLCFSSAKAARDPFARTSGGTTSYVLLFFHLPLVKVGFSAARAFIWIYRSWILSEQTLWIPFNTPEFIWNYSSRRDDSSAWPGGWWIGWCFQSLFGIVREKHGAWTSKNLIRSHDTILCSLAAEERSVYRSEHTRCLRSGLSLTF